MKNQSIKSRPKKTNQFRTLTFYANKGGNGKTSSAIIFATILAEKGYKVILIDNDGQGNSSDFCGAPAFPTPGVVRTENLYLEINRKTPKRDERIDVNLLVNAIQETADGFCFIECSKLLDSIERVVNNEDMKYTIWRITQALRNSFDFCIIDSPCKDDILSANAVIASDDIIVSVATESDTNKTLSNTKFAFKAMESNYKINPNIDRVLPVKIKTQYHQNTTLELIRTFANEHFKCKMACAYIKHSTDIENALSSRGMRMKSIKSGRTSDAFIAYIDVVEEYLRDHGINDDSEFSVANIPLIETKTTEENQLIVGKNFKRKIVCDYKEVVSSYLDVVRNFLKSEGIENSNYTRCMKTSDGKKEIVGVIVEMGKKKGLHFSNEECCNAICRYFDDIGIEYSVRKVL